MTAVQDADRRLRNDGYLHEIGLYDSDQDFLDLAVPFAIGGVEAGEPVVFAYDAHKTALLAQHLPDDPSITFASGPYMSPARALDSWRKVVEGLIRRGARRVRIAGNVPHPGYGRSYAGWDRYEAAVDRALGDLPVWAPCLYDTRLAPADVIDAALRLHRCRLDRDGHRDNEAFSEHRHLGDFIAPDPDPLESTIPAFELRDPTVREVRDELTRVIAGSAPAARLDDVLLVASEAVANALVHGTAPVLVRAWRASDRVVVSVRDAGRGPADPLAGLVPRDHRSASGRGLWLCHVLSIETALRVDREGFTVAITCPLSGRG